MLRSSQHFLLLGFLLALLCMSMVRNAYATTAAQIPSDSARSQRSYVPSTTRQYTMLVEELTGGLDEKGTQPTLVSVTEEATLTLPAASATAAAAWEGDAEFGEIDADAASHLTFNEDFDPIWYYVLRRRGFEHLDWSGCGGKWRPEWSIPKRHASGGGTTSSSSVLLFDQLRHYLAHHAVCTYSAVSFCGASRERDAASQFQWAAQFISTLTSTPLSWTDASSRHTRPNGVLLRSSNGNSNAVKKEGMEVVGEGNVDYWCSYHLVYHDTLCTQHVSPLLNGGRSGRGVQEGLPLGIFKAVFPSFVHFFGSPFQHFTVKAGQERKPANSSAGATAVVELKVQIRMSMVARERSELTALADVWARELPAYASEGRLAIHIGPGGLSKRLRAALPASAIASGEEDVQKEERNGDAVSSPKEGGSGAVGWSPEVQYEVHAHGKDHGYLTVELQPGLATLDAQVDVDVGDNDDEDVIVRPHQYRLQAGDVVRTLLLFPLHLLRPSLHNMESLLGSTHIVQAHPDVSANTLAVLLETPITAVHVAAYEAAYVEAQQRHRRGNNGDRQRGRPEGVMLARFPLFVGWTALHEMPPDDNSNRVVPQPVVVITRAFNRTFGAEKRDEEKVGGAEDVDFCTAQRQVNAAATHSGIPPLDHVRSLSAVFQLLNKTFVWTDGKTSTTSSNPFVPSTVNSSSANTCVYWVRSTAVSGLTIPGPDGAMVFNVLSLGLIFSAVGAGMLTRLTRRLTLRPDDLATLG